GEAQMPATYLAILLAAVGCSVAGMLIIRRYIPPEKLAENNEYVGFTFSMLSLIYGIYLAFTVVVVWQQYEAAEETVTTEVVLMATVWRSVEVLPAEDRDRLRRDLIAYTRGVIEDDYPLMATGQKSTFSAHYEKLWEDFYRVQLTSGDARQEAFYSEALSRLNEFSIARRSRILASQASLPPSMWVLLIVGAMGAIAFTWFYSTPYRSIQIAATAFLSAIIIYAVLLVAMLEYPFGSGVSVGDLPYRELLERFESLIKSGG
ncbi:MAG TPA: DUF4239 domain-containing protein, partial [Vicinamibacterales bacterium]|nr:DUF4239 domain-containing protein [Vicinamibacterales bacterium]